MRVEAFQLKKHYSLVAQWWLKNTGEVLEFSLLPKTGFIAVSGDTPVCACFMLLTNSGMAIISYVVSNRDAPVRLIGKGFDMLIDHCECMGRALDVKHLLSVSTSAGFSKKLKKRFGFEGWRPHELVFKKLV